MEGERQAPGMHAEGFCYSILSLSIVLKEFLHCPIKIRGYFLSFVKCIIFSFGFFYRSRMYYETISQVLPDVKLFINSGDGSNVQSLLPLDSLVTTNGGEQQ